MKRVLQGLLVAALLAPLCQVAHGETMAERKQRIMRKYLRERQTVAQGDITLPEPEEENKLVTDSEKYQQTKKLLSSDNTTTPLPAPLVRPVPIPVKQTSWLLDEDPDADPYADPFAEDSGDKKTASKTGQWTTWQDRQAVRSSEQPAAPAYDYRGSGRTYSRGQSGYGNTEQQDPSSRSSTWRSSQATDGQQQGRQLGPYGTGTYGSSPSGMLQLPSSSQGSANGSDSQSQGGFTPYQSPYQTQQDQRRQQMYPQQQQRQQQQQQQQEYTKPKPQQWKVDNKTWDPTSDDAYLNELNRRNRN